MPIIHIADINYINTHKWSHRWQ